MPAKQRSDAMKATNTSLTSPERDIESPPGQGGAFHMTPHERVEVGGRHGARSKGAQARSDGSREPAQAEQGQREQPKPPFPKQHQKGVGIEAKLKPQPRYEAPQYKPAGKLQGKSALITGGDSGIGRAVAYLYAREGADVAIVYTPLPDYSATKGAINAFTKALAQSLIEKGIRVNAVAPGPIWTPLNPSDAGMTPEKVAKFGSDVPMKRPAQPEEIAPAYVFLASDADSSYISGIVLAEMGGSTTAG